MWLELHNGAYQAEICREGHWWRCINHGIETEAQHHRCTRDAQSNARLELLAMDKGSWADDKYRERSWMNLLWLGVLGLGKRRLRCRWERHRKTRRCCANEDTHLGAHSCEFHTSARAFKGPIGHRFPRPTALCCPNAHSVHRLDGKPQEDRKGQFPRLWRELQHRSALANTGGKSGKWTRFGDSHSEVDVQSEGLQLRLHQFRRTTTMTASCALVATLYYLHSRNPFSAWSEAPTGRVRVMPS